MPVVLSVSAHDPRGAGCHADVRTGEALGVPVIAVPTALTVQSPRVERVEPVDPGLLREAVSRYLPGVDAVKLGAFPNVETAEVVASEVKGFEGPVVMDPVVEATAGGRLCTDPEDALGTLLDVADVVTPNAEELSLLSGEPVRTDVEAERAARVLMREHDLLGVLVTGVPYPNRVDMWVPENGEAVAFDVPDGRDAHASGCVVATALACLASVSGGVDEETVKRALSLGRSAVSGALEDGFGPVASPGAEMRRKAAMADAIEDVGKAVNVIDGNPRFAEAVPQVGINVVRVFDPSSGIDGVVGLSGRVILDGSVPRALGRPVPGGSSHVARLVLTAHRFDPSVEGGVNIRYRREYLERAEELGFDVAGFDRRDEPEGVSTMEWCVERIYDELGFVPDVIYDEGDVGKEPMIRVLGRSAVEAVSKAASMVGGR